LRCGSGAGCNGRISIWAPAIILFCGSARLQDRLGAEAVLSWMRQAKNIVRLTITDDLRVEFETTPPTMEFVQISPDGQR
jgi:hypothetical protein